MMFGYESTYPLYRLSKSHLQQWFWLKRVMGKMYVNGQVRGGMERKNNERQKAKDMDREEEPCF